MFAKPDLLTCIWLSTFIFPAWLLVQLLLHLPSSSLFILWFIFFLLSALLPKCVFKVLRNMCIKCNKMLLANLPNLVQPNVSTSVNTCFAAGIERRAHSAELRSCWEPALALTLNIQRQRQPTLKQSRSLGLHRNTTANGSSHGKNSYCSYIILLGFGPTLWVESQTIRVLN